MEIIISNQRVLIDVSDYNKIKKKKWNAAWSEKSQAYNVRTYLSKNKKLSLSRFLMNNPEGMVVDHINHNTLDNRKSNLRICTLSQNNMNARVSKYGTSKYKGVYWNKEKKKWRVDIFFKGRRYYLGVYKNEIKAAKVYNKNAMKLFKEYAVLNKFEGETK